MAAHSTTVDDLGSRPARGSAGGERGYRPARAPLPLFALDERAHVIDEGPPRWRRSPNARVVTEPLALLVAPEIMGGTMGDLIDLLERPTYGLGQVDRILGLHAGTSRRWIDGYRRGGKAYPPVIRQESTGDEIATWGEFIETRLLAEYRDAGVPLIRMRPAIEVLREELNTPYPLASARTWLEVDSRDLVRRAQEKVDLDPSLSLVIVRERQQPLWSKPADEFRRSLEWTPGNGNVREIRLLRPVADIEHVTIDPLRGFGEPVVRGVRTEVIAELVRAGDPPEMIAEMYELPRSWVDQAVRYELLRVA